MRFETGNGSVSWPSFVVAGGLRKSFIKGGDDFSFQQHAPCGKLGGDLLLLRVKRSRGRVALLAGDWRDQMFHLVWENLEVSGEEPEIDAEQRGRFGTTCSDTADVAIFRSFG